MPDPFDTIEAGNAATSLVVCQAGPILQLWTQMIPDNELHAWIAMQNSTSLVHCTFRYTAQRFHTLYCPSPTFLLLPSGEDHNHRESLRLVSCTKIRELKTSTAASNEMSSASRKMGRVGIGEFKCTTHEETNKNAIVKIADLWLSRIMAFCIDVRSIRMECGSVSPQFTPPPTSFQYQPDQIHLAVLIASDRTSVWVASGIRHTFKLYSCHWLK